MLQNCGSRRSPIPVPAEGEARLDGNEVPAGNTRAGTRLTQPTGCGGREIP
jgi:hypothetical protein